MKRTLSLSGSPPASVTFVYMVVEEDAGDQTFYVLTAPLAVVAPFHARVLEHVRAERSRDRAYRGYRNTTAFLLRCIAGKETAADWFGYWPDLRLAWQEATQNAAILDQSLWSVLKSNSSALEQLRCDCFTWVCGF